MVSRVVKAGRDKTVSVLTWAKKKRKINIIFLIIFCYRRTSVNSKRDLYSSRNDALPWWRMENCQSNICRNRVISILLTLIWICIKYLWVFSWDLLQTSRRCRRKSVLHCLFLQKSADKNKNKWAVLLPRFILYAKKFAKDPKLTTKVQV